MSFRGRGRGRGFGGGYFKSEPFVLFPDIELPDAKAVPDERTLVIRNSRLLKYWKASPYYIEENVSKKNESIDIERFSDWSKPKNTAKRNSLFQVLQLQSHNFPKELIGDSRRAQRSAKKMRWNLDSGMLKLDMFEKFEKDLEDKEGKEKKGDGEEENSDEDQGEESDQSYSDDGDYNENEHFDDDEDDYNMADDHDDEPIY
ncbi:hypothetical protein HRI_002277200 [Hibiscus trionum]|uniref:DNA-directed RNA polymerase III subunit n=1 Tax=Hibiscus trionum TaxID=183268 RepID=A0A9W7HYP4_HIBTR|nr:hypothetical protein HRI_002277200 [Hibiscus trionum]